MARAGYLTSSFLSGWLFAELEPPWRATDRAWRTHGLKGERGFERNMFSQEDVKDNFKDLTHGTV